MIIVTNDKCKSQKLSKKMKPTILYDWRKIKARRPDLGIINMRKRIRHLVDFAASKSENQKIYFDLAKKNTNHWLQGTVPVP